MLEESILVALVIGLTEVIKRAVGLESRYIPAVAVVWGIILAFIGSQANWISMNLVSGIIAGLLAVGLFSSVKNSLGK